MILSTINTPLIDSAFVFARENRFLLQEREIMGQQLECALLLHDVDVVSSISDLSLPTDRHDQHNWFSKRQHPSLADAQLQFSQF